ncbi:MAG: hypothetical protein GX591_10410 [Planctomycetes bacterium]|nr:hypothetical protein [Planctomycetota bacterium]
MRPPPRPRHLVAVLVFAGVAAIGGLLAFGETRLDDRQVAMATGAVRAVHEDYYPHDVVYGSDALWKLDNPIWRWYLRETFRATGRGEAAWVFAVAVGPLVFVFGLGMYALVWRQCRSWSLAVYAALMAMVVIHLADDVHWGLGPRWTVTPATVALAAVPWAVLGLLTFGGDAAVLWVFLGVGLLGNIHLVTATNLALVFAIVVVGRGRASPRSWMLAAAGLLCAAGAASPVFRYQTVQAAAFSGAGPWSHWRVALAAESDPIGQNLGAMVSRALEFPSMGYLLALWLPAVAVTVRCERYRVRDLGAWLWMLLGVFIVGGVLHGLIAWSGASGDLSAAALGFPQALRLSLLPLFVLAAQAVSHLTRSWGAGRVVRTGLTVLMILWLLPADNVAVARHAVQDCFVGGRDDEKPPAVQHRIERRARDRELRAICRWLRRNTPTSAVIACEDPHARLWAARSLVACQADRHYVQVRTPDRLEAWAARLQDQREALSPRTGGAVEPAALDRFGLQYGAAYIVVDAASVSAASMSGGWVKDPSGRWGAYLRLYRVGTVETAPPVAAGAPAQP